MISKAMLRASVMGISLQLLPTAVHAQQAQSPTDARMAAETATSDSTGDIVVTARRRSERLQDVPISITAMSGETLKDRGVSDLKALTNFTPGLEINNGRSDGGSTTAQIFIRGVGQNDFLIPNDPGVGLYVDDVYVARSTGAITGLSDVQSIEVLRGPQGTLYGKNTIGGAVRITTVAPDLDEFSGHARATFGSYKRMDFSGSVNVPVSDGFAIRLAASSRNTDDLQKRYLDASGAGQGNINQDAMRIVARWKPDDRLDVTISADYTRTDQHMGYGGNIGYVAGGSPLIDVLNAEVYSTNSARYGQPAGTRFDARWSTAPGAVGATGPNSDKYDVWGVSGVITYALTPEISIKSISAYRSVKGAAGRDGDSSPFPVLETISADNNKQFSQEFQLNGSSFSDRFKWTLGFYYIDEKLENRITTKLWGDLIQTSVNVDFNARSLGKLHGQSLAVFGQGTFDLTDQLHVTVGGRYNHEKKDFNNRWYFLEQPRAFTCPGLDVNGVLDNCKQTDNVFTPMASIAYNFSDQVMAYASYSEGFKAGGWTPRLFSQQSLKRYSPEKLKAYEVGLKTTLLDRRLIFNIDAFQSDYSNLQLTSVRADSTGAPQPVVENAGEARIRGIEVETSLRLGSGTTIQGGLAYMHGEYLRLDPGVSFPLSAKLPETPKLALNGSIEQRFDLASGAKVTARLDASYKSKTYKEPSNVEAVAQKPFVLLNGRIGYSSPGDKFSFAVFGTNLLDKRYLTSGLDLVSTFGIYEAYFGRPREFGIEFSANF